MGFYMKKILSNTLSILYKDKNKKHFWLMPLFFILYIGSSFISDSMLSFVDIVFIHFLKSLFHIYLVVILFYFSLLLSKNIPVFISDENKEKEEYKIFFRIHRLIMRKLNVIAKNNNFNKRFLAFFYLMILSLIISCSTDLLSYYGDIERSLAIKVDSFSSVLVFSYFIYTFIPFSLVFFHNSYKRFKKKYLINFLFLFIFVSFIRLLDLPIILEVIFFILHATLFLFAISLAIISISYENKLQKLNKLIKFLNEENIEMSDTMKEKIYIFKENGLFKEICLNTLASKIVGNNSSSYINIYIDIFNSHDIDTPVQRNEDSLRKKLAIYKEQLDKKNRELESKKYVDKAI